MDGERVPTVGWWSMDNGMLEADSPIGSIIVSRPSSSYPSGVGEAEISRRCFEPIPLAAAT